MFLILPGIELHTIQVQIEIIFYILSDLVGLLLLLLLQCARIRVYYLYRR